MKDKIYYERVEDEEGGSFNEVNINEIKKLAQRDAFSKSVYKLRELPDVIDKTDAISIIEKLKKQMR